MQCVVFDMDGVLFDSEALVLQCWEQTAKLHGIPEIQEICTGRLGSNADMARQMFLEKYGPISPTTHTRRRCPQSTGRTWKPAGWN